MRVWTAGLLAAALLAGTAGAKDYDLRIQRDEWGVPHVKGETDADVAYGLAWAQAEDDFKPVLFTEDQLMGHIKRDYRPGE